MNHFYILPGIDASRQRSDAEKKQRQGHDCWLHNHKAGEPCTDVCQYFPTPCRSEDVDG